MSRRDRDRNRRNNRSRRDRYDDRDYRRKSYAEARIERITWFLMVVMFAVLQLLDLESSGLKWLIPLAGAVILLGSGLYQYARGWIVSPVTWLGGAAMVGLVFFNLYINPAQSFLSATLVVFAVVILVGLLTGET